MWPSAMRSPSSSAAARRGGPQDGVEPDRDDRADRHPRAARARQPLLRAQHHHPDGPRGPRRHRPRGGRRRHQPLHLAPGRGPALLRPLDRPRRGPAHRPLRRRARAGHGVDARASPGPTRRPRPRPGRSSRTSRFGTAAYSLRITPPARGLGPRDRAVDRPVRAATSPTPVTRSIQSQIHPTSIADFQMISNATIKYGSTATTTGKLYSAGDINHQGVAKAPAYAQHWACSSSTFDCPSSSTPGVDLPGRRLRLDHHARRSRTSSRPRSTSATSPSRASTSRTRPTAGGTAWNDPTANAWMVQFLADGRARVLKITGTSDVGAPLSTIGCPVTVNVPANGAMYFEQSVIVSDGSNKTDSCNSTVGPAPLGGQRPRHDRDQGQRLHRRQHHLRRLGRRRARA